MCCNSAPDTSGINAAAQANAQVGQQALDFYKQVYADQAPLRQQASDTAQQVSQAQLAALNTATGQAQDYADYNKRTFRPLEQRIVSEAEGFDTPEREEQNAGRAIADVQNAGAAQTAAAQRNLTRMGVNPSDGSFGALQREADANITLGSAAAANNARLQTQATGRALMSDAANLGRNIPSNQATQQQIALTSGNSAVGNAQVPMQVAAQGAQLAGQGFNTAISANNSSGNLYGQAAQIQNNANAANSAAWGSLGSAAGGFLGNPALGTLVSDKNQKEKRRPMKGEVALAMARKMPVEKWRYKASSAAADGGKEHIGPMAQSVNAAAGETAAPGGKVIDPVTMHGITLAAVQHLDKKMAKLEKKRA